MMIGPRDFSTPDSRPDQAPETRKHGKKPATSPRSEETPASLPVLTPSSLPDTGRGHIPRPSFDDQERVPARSISTPADIPALRVAEIAYVDPERALRECESVLARNGAKLQEYARKLENLARQERLAEQAEEQLAAHDIARAEGILRKHGIDVAALAPDDALLEVPEIRQVYQQAQIDAHFVRIAKQHAETIRLRDAVLTENDMLEAARARILKKQGGGASAPRPRKSDLSQLDADA
jgi:hypothetical protein